MLLLSSALVAVTVLPLVSLAAPDQDRVTALPGLTGALDSPMYSGYLDTSPTDKVHYLLQESKSSHPESDPLVLWLQGGPGASSLLGAFQEQGNYILSSDTSVFRNPFSWNQVANVLFLESPTGVGFSYCEANLNGGKCQHNDTSTAELNLSALMQFVEKFPEYQGREFMIWGESYAGVFVPTLANLVYESDLKLNFAGFSVGDPCTSEKYQHLSGQLHFNLSFAFHNGFISTQQYAFLLGNCVLHDANGHLVPDTSDPGCKLAWRVYYIATANNDGQNVQGFEANLGKYGKFINTFNDYGPDGGPFNTMLRNYLSSPEVRQALHVTEAPVERWGMGDNLVYTKQHLACFYEEGTPATLKPLYNASMLPIYEKLAGKLRNIVVFNGDTDPDVQYRGTEAAIESLGLKVLPGGDWRPWFYKPNGVSASVLENKMPQWGELLSYKPMNPQLGGYVKNYESNVSFVTIHTSGHMVPQFKPVSALQFFSRVLYNMHLSPLLDMSQVESCSDSEFFGTSDAEGYMGEWINEAQSSSFSGYY